MSTRVISDCWPLGGMSILQKAVLISLADNANDDGFCWPSVTTICERVCGSDRAVRAAIACLERSGAIQANHRVGRSTMYKITPKDYRPLHIAQDCGKVTSANAAGTPANAAGMPLQMPQGGLQMPQDTPANAAGITVKNRKEPKIEPTDNPLLSVFTHWQNVMGKGQAKLDAKRKRAITGRLKDGYTVEQLCRAVTGCSLSSWHMGKNERNRAYNDIELICRDAAKVDQFIAMADSPPETEAERRKRELEEWASGGDCIEGELVNG